MDWLTDPLTSHAFFGRALLALVLAGAICGALGAYVIVRRMSYIAHGLSHAVIGGAAIAAALNISLLLGAAGWAFLSAVLIDRVSRRRGLYPDAAIGIVTTTSFALGNRDHQLGAWHPAEPGELPVRLDPGCRHLGPDPGRRGGGRGRSGAVRALRPLLFATFDPDVASAHGVHVGCYEILFAVLLTAGIVASMRVLGVLLVAAAVVIPPATVRLLTNRFTRRLPLGAGLGATSALPGMYLSWYLDIAPGPAVVLAQATGLTLAWLWSSARQRRLTATT